MSSTTNRIVVTLNGCATLTVQGQPQLTRQDALILCECVGRHTSFVGDPINDGDHVCRWCIKDEKEAEEAEGEEDEGEEDEEEEDEEEEEVNLDGCVCMRCKYEVLCVSDDVEE